MGLLERARGRDTNDTVLRHPITTLLLGLVIAGIFGAFTAGSIITPDPPDPLGREWVVFPCFVLLFGAVVYGLYHPVRGECPDECPVRYLLYGWVGSVILAALIVWVPRVGFPVFLLAPTLAGVVYIWMYFKERHRLEPGGLCYRRSLTGSGTLRWSEVGKVHYSQVMGLFRLVTRQGEIVRVSVWLIGLPAFARAVLAGVPGTSIDTDTRQVLEQTAVGILPPLPGGGH
jgi:hypothetical protein